MHGACIAHGGRLPHALVAVVQQGHNTAEQLAAVVEVEGLAQQTTEACGGNDTKLQ